jgi:hypothetical protein
MISLRTQFPELAELRNGIISGRARYNTKNPASQDAGFC